MSDAISILIADDSPTVRWLLRELIDPEPDMELVAQAEDGEDAIQKARYYRPDVIMLDMMMPRKNGIEAIVEIRRDNPEARILMLTGSGEDDKVFPAIEAGAQGYVLKGSPPSELLQAIRDVHSVHRHSSLPLPSG